LLLVAYDRLLKDEVAVVSTFFNGIRTYLDTYVFSTVKNMGILDFVDILLLGFILYFLYRFIRDRRAGKLLFGLGIVLILSLMGEALEMPATKFIFSDFRQIGVIAILILFQPELRSALEKVGGTSWSGIRSITSDSRDYAVIHAEIDAICTAANDLSRDKVGALIAIERSTKLGEYIKSGVYIDAALSPYILRNIFFNNAPLHDGAVIIRSGRICAAGCFLPLSTNEEIDKDLGTRHRAAIGLSECSDAIVIVVSEETGVISVVTDGNIKRNYNYNSLKQTLNGMLIPQGVGDHVKKHRKNKEKV
jgi:diadenylate cyclase